MKTIPILAACAALWPASAAALQTGGDTTPPGEVSGLSVLFIPSGDGFQAEMSWTASGDDGAFGRADHYLIRWSPAALDSAAAWQNATPVAAPSPADSGQSQNHRFGSFLADRTYYFGIVAVDEVSRESGLVSVGGATPPPSSDVMAPGSVGALEVYIDPGLRVHYTWRATGDDGSVGRAARYDMRWSAEPLLTPSGWEAATRLTSPPTPRSSGSFETHWFDAPGIVPGVTYNFGVVAIDEVGNCGEIAWTPAERATMPGG